MSMFPASGASFQPVISEVVNACSEQPFVGEVIAPVQPVNIRTGKYVKVEANQFNNDLSKPRAAGSNFAMAIGEYTSQTFECLEFGVDNQLDDIDIAQAETDAQFDVTASVAQRLRDDLRIGHEIRVANLMSAASFGSTSATAAMSVAASATPIADINAAVFRLNSNGIFGDIAVVMESSLYSEMLLTDQMKSLVNGAAWGPAWQTEQVSRVVGVDSIVVCNTRYNAALKGQTASTSKIWPTTSYYVAQVRGGSLSSGGCARTLAYTERGGVFITETYRTEQPPANVIRVRMSTDEVILNANAGEKVTGA